MMNCHATVTHAVEEGTRQGKCLELAQNHLEVTQTVALYYSRYHSHCTQTHKFFLCGGVGGEKGLVHISKLWDKLRGAESGKQFSQAVLFLILTPPGTVADLGGFDETFVAMKFI